MMVASRYELITGNQPFSGATYVPVTAATPIVAIGMAATTTAALTQPIRLPEPPTGTLGFSNAIAADDRVILNGQGWLLDVPTGIWTYVPRPTGGTDAEQAVAIGDGDLYVWGGVTWGNDVALDNDQNPLSAAGWVAQ
jgi:hypothetical protein